MRKCFFTWLMSLMFLALSFSSCKQPQNEAASLEDSEIIHENMDRLTRLIIYDVFSPPVASRIYAYTSLAAFEAIRFSQPEKYPSLLPRLKDFKPLPEPEKGLKYDFALASTQAFFTVARKVTFSVDSFLVHEKRIYGQFENKLDEETYKRSIEFGKKIGEIILDRSKNDNYPQTRGKPKFIGSQEPGLWRPTPPDYLDAVEYCWGTMKTFAIDSSGQFPTPPPPPYSEDTSSVFFKVNMDVYSTFKNLSQEQKDIARYWDDNPFVLEHSGHMMFANKKITPGGHWVGITAIACKKVKADPIRTAQAYALSSIAVFDAFICCWEEKFRTNVIRPVSVINEKIDPNWMPLLQTPPFPEYPSGHSTISRAAATVLTRLFGDNFAFHDTSDLEYIGMQKSFNSFIEAANEASISRVYGGIHYRHSVDAGADQGRRVAEYIIRQLKL